MKGITIWKNGEVVIKPLRLYSNSQVENAFLEVNAFKKAKVTMYKDDGTKVS